MRFPMIPVRYRRPLPVPGRLRTGVSSPSRYLLCLALSGLAPSFAASAGEQALPVFDVPTVEHIGRALYEQERRVAIASEMVHDNFDVDEERIIGYVTVGEPTHLTVRYLRPAPDGYEVVVDAVFEDLLLPALIQPGDPHLKAAEIAQASARRLAAEDLSARCDGRYNTLAVQDPAGPDLLVYGIAASSDPEKLMIGGHVRYRFAADGREIKATEPLATSCAATSRTGLTTAANSDGSKGLGVRNSLSDTPLESHVLMSLLYGIPLFVVTADQKMWKVADGHMQVFRSQPGEIPK